MTTLNTIALSTSSITAMKKDELSASLKSGLTSAKLSKVTKGVSMNIDISFALVQGSVILNHEGESIVIDLATIPASVIGHLLAYGIGRHAADSLSSSNEERLKDIAHYFACYAKGYLTPKELEKALAPKPEKATKKGKKATTQTVEKSFLLWLDNLILNTEEEETANKLLKLLAMLESTPFALPDLKANESLLPLVEDFEAFQLEEAKKAEEEEAKKAEEAKKGIAAFTF